MSAIELAVMDMKNAQTWMDFITANAQQNLTQYGEWRRDWEEEMHEAQARYDAAKAIIERHHSELIDAFQFMLQQPKELIPCPS